MLDLRGRLSVALDVAKGINYLHCLNPPIGHLKTPNMLVDKNWYMTLASPNLSRPPSYLPNQSLEQKLALVSSPASASHDERGSQMNPSSCVGHLSRGSNDTDEGGAAVTAQARTP